MRMQLVVLYNGALTQIDIQNANTERYVYAYVPLWKRFRANELFLLAGSKCSAISVPTFYT